MCVPGIGVLALNASEWMTVGVLYYYYKLSDDNY